MIKKNIEVVEQIKLKDVEIPALFLISTELYCISTFQICRGLQDGDLQLVFDEVNQGQAFM